MGRQADTPIPLASASRAPASAIGVLDPGALRHLLEVELARSRRYEHPFALLEVSIGGVAPESAAAVAHRAAGALRMHTRWADSVGFGEDATTLLVILRDTPAPGAQTVADKIRESLPGELGGAVACTVRSAAWRKGDDLGRLLARLG